MFKLLEANKRYKILKPGHKVVDLGCAPGSWSKLAAQLVGPKGIVYSVDIQALTPQELQVMGVIDPNLPKADQKKQLKIERELSRSTAPVIFQQADVTVWTPPKEIRKRIDVILSDMAPKTTGIPDNDADLSAELCHAVLDLAPQLFRTSRTADSEIDEDNGDHETNGELKEPPKTQDSPNLLTDAFSALHVGHLSARTHQAGGKHHMDADGTVEVDLEMFRDENGELNVSRLKKVIRRPGLVQPLPREKEALAKKSQDGGFNESQDAGAQHPSQRRKGRGVLFMKVFQGGECFNSVIQRLKEEFASVQTFKPESSRSESVEVFLLARNYLGKPAYHLNPFRSSLESRQQSGRRASEQILSRKELIEQHREAEAKYSMAYINSNNPKDIELHQRLRKYVNLRMPTGEETLVNEENARYLADADDIYFSSVSHRPRKMPESLKKFLADRAEFEARRIQEAQVRAQSTPESEQFNASEDTNSRQSSFDSMNATEAKSKIAAGSNTAATPVVVSNLTESAITSADNSDVDQVERREDLTSSITATVATRRLRARRPAAPTASPSAVPTDLESAIKAGLIGRIDDFPDLKQNLNGLVWELVEGEEEEGDEDDVKARNSATSSKKQSSRSAKGRRLFVGGPLKWSGQKH